MSNLITTAVEQIDYPFLLVTHMVCADQQIHSQQSKALHELASQIRVGKRTLEEMEKILAQDEHQMSVKDVTCKVPPSQQSEAMQQILALAYIDGFLSPFERMMVERVARIWNWPVEEVQWLIEEAEGFTATYCLGDDNDQPELSISTRLLMGAESILSRSLVNKLAEIAPQNVGRQIEQLQREILLAGPEYDDAIRQCAAIAREDYKFAEVALKGVWSALYDLGKGIQYQQGSLQSKTSGKGQAKTTAEVARQFETTRKALTGEIIAEIQTVRKSLSAKQHDLNHFSIAFMGKTKAGKSTLYTIITGEGWDAIGIGKQRTTRLNRVYEWKNIRIIDTPGIGAPGGKTDEEIAQSVIEESDVICYVVTTDSIQESEFGFLELLKEKAKPLIILLNVHNNFRDSRRDPYEVERFLNNPDKLFVMDGSSGLGEQIERIRRYAKQHYTNDSFDIVPVMLLAAQLSREPEHEQHKDKLFKASRMQAFLDSIRESLVKHGTIRRSQTLLGSTVGAVDNPYKWITQQAQVYQQLTDKLKNKRETIQKQIKAAAKDNRESIQQQIEAIFQDALNAIPSFAEDHWNSNKLGLKLGWEQKLKDINFDERLKTAYQETSQKFNKEVEKAIEEVGNELELVAQVYGGNFSFTDQNSNNLGIGIAAGVIGGIVGLFKSKDKNCREAVQNISSSLAIQLNNHRQITLQHASDNLGKYSNSVAMSINTYFEELIARLEVIAVQLEAAKTKLSGTTSYLNRAYAKRIIDWCLEQYEPLTEEKTNRTIAKLKREFGRSMNIQTKSSLQLRKSQDELKRVLQEDVSIQPIKY